MPERFEARYVTAPRSLTFLRHLEDLPCHIGRVHQRELPAGRGADIPLRNVCKVGVGASGFRYRYVNTTMAGGPATVENVFFKEGLPLHLAKPQSIFLMKVVTPQQ